MTRHLYTFDKGTLGCDYLDSRIQPSSVRSAGYNFIGRYLRNLTRNEINNAAKSGLGIIPVFQNTNATSNLNQGFLGGKLDGINATQQAAELGIPPTEVIIAAVDTDVTVHNVSMMCEYLDGFAFGCYHPLGIYGDWDIIEARGHKSRLNIQAAAEAWSYDWAKPSGSRWKGVHPKTHLRQYKQQAAFGSQIDRLEVTNTSAIIWAGPRNPLLI